MGSISEIDPKYEFPIINHHNRETFECKGRTYLTTPSLSEFLVEAGITNIRHFKMLIKDLSISGVETFDDLLSLSKSKILQLDSTTIIIGNQIFDHIIKVKHQGSILTNMSKLMQMELDHFYLKIDPTIDKTIFQYSNGKLGLRSQSLVELCGADGVGKTQWCLYASTQALQIGKRVIYIDTEGGFDVNRIKQIGISSHLSQRSISDNIDYSRIDTFDEIDVVLDEVVEIAKSGNVGLIIIDSIMEALHNSYPVGFEDNLDLIAARQLHLRKTMRKLRYLAKKFNLIVLYTNHTSTTQYRIPISLLEQELVDSRDEIQLLISLIKRLELNERPMGGSTLSHSSDMRIFLGKTGDPLTFTARVENCPYLPRSSINYIISNDGISGSNLIDLEYEKHIDNLNDILG